MAQPVRFKPSKNFEAIRSRMRRLPKLINGAMDASAKKDIISVIEEYQKGIYRNNFGLQGLNDQTIRIKSEEGLSKPKTPFYGKGYSEKNSLINALFYRKIKNGYRLYRRRAKHHKADLPLNVLLSIHEHGAVIKVTKKMRNFLHYLGIHLKKETNVIRIPPRLIVNKAINRALRKKKKGEPSISIRAAINELIKKGNDSIFKKLTRG